MLLFEGHFCHWKMRNILKRLDLALAYWCKSLTRFPDIMGIIDLSNTQHSNLCHHMFQWGGPCEFKGIIMNIFDEFSHSLRFSRYIIETESIWHSVHIGTLFPFSSEVFVVPIDQFVDGIISRYKSRNRISDKGESALTVKTHIFRRI